MKRTKLILIMIFLLPPILLGLENDPVLVGRISYLNSQNIYVRFESKLNVQIGDTLYSNTNGKWIPAVLVTNFSSLSCVCKPLDYRYLEKSDSLHLIKKEKTKRSVPPLDPEARVAKLDVENTSPEDSVETPFDLGLKGRLRISSYSNISSTETPVRQKFRYTLSLSSINPGGSKLSAETYTSFSHELDNWAEIQKNVFSALKIYSLALKYDASENTSFWLGRKINPKLSNIGAVDGFMGETRIKKFSFGGVTGTRPDYEDYSFNLKLFEYGAYVGHSHAMQNGQIQSSLAFFEQRNSGNIDRRFAYLQHSNTLLKNLSLFTSAELELFRLNNEVKSTSPSLTSLYISLRYRMLKKLTLFASFDTRKNVIYYETFKDYADRLLEEATRQGFRFNINYRVTQKISMGVNGGYRVRDSDIRPTKNLNGFITFSQIPWVKTSATFSANMLQTSYLDGLVFRVRLNKDIVPGVLNMGLNYRYIDYEFNNSNTVLLQNTVQANLSWKIIKKLSLSFDIESTFEESRSYHRIYLNLIKRF